MVGGTIRRKVIHRESFRASVLHPSEIQAVLQSIAEKKCLLTTPSLLSSGTRLRVHREAGRLVRHKYPSTQSVSKTKKVTRAIFALPKLFPMIQGECETNRVEDCAPLSGGRP